MAARRVPRGGRRGSREGPAAGLSAHPAQGPPPPPPRPQARAHVCHPRARHVCQVNGYKQDINGLKQGINGYKQVYFGDAPLVEVSARSYPVQTYFLEDLPGLIGTPLPGGGVPSTPSTPALARVDSWGCNAEEELDDAESTGEVRTSLLYYLFILLVL
eukprot:64177-Prorocentrum_minimum.AAC.1